MYPLLKGLRIVDITTILLGPFATQILGDMGADVIKIEAPDGDQNRWNPPFGEPGIGAGFANNNRNKRSLSLDLKREEAKEILRRLIGTADALVHNMRQDALDRLGFGWEACRALNPRLVYCAALGYGSDGPYSGKPAYDDIIQAAGGIAGLTWARDGAPAYHPTVTADKVGALHVVYAVLAALLHRERTGGQGQLVEMPMLEATAAFSLNENLMGATYEDDGALGYHRTMSRNRKPYPTKDGYIALLPYTTAQWRRVLDALGREDITSAAWFESNTERSKRADELYAVLAASLGSRTSVEWLALFERLDVPCGPVHTLSALLDDPHLAAVGFFEPCYSTPTPARRALRQPVLWRGLEREPDRPAPRLGADSATLLAELGYDAAAIASLAQAKVVSGADGER
ncbi:MAG: CoA transferase [Hyphomicrobiaceae bacterium]|nr:CoA transferase [Hyphomicrobiaceae bacterium]